MKKKLITAACAVVVSSALFSYSAFADTSLSKVFISYFSPKNVEAMVNYAKGEELGGLIIWEFRGDTGFQQDNSLLKTAVKTYAPNASNPPMIMGYWSDWSVYADDSATRQYPEPAYGVPGSFKNERPMLNQDFTDKLAGMNVVTYAFLEARGETFQGKPNTDLSKTGTLFFNDPWSDLRIDKDADFCNAKPDICDYTMRHNTNWKEELGMQPFMSMGNFSAFATLQRADTQNLGPLKKVISIGGYGHDYSFEDTFKDPSYVKNFVDSTVAIVEAYKLDGIDLDYENPRMTHAQSQQYLALIEALRADPKLANKIISVTVLSGKPYLEGSANVGFAPEVLKKIAAKVNTINLMTYDFHGAFDYPGTTGFLTSLYKPTDAPADYKFNVEESVQFLKDQGIPNKQIVIGIPAYGRALQGIPAGSTGGLFETIPSTAKIPVGDLDEKSCNTSIPLQGYACSGSFQYKFIVENMLNKGFEAKDWPQAVGTTAYAESWTPIEVPNATLQISNTGGAFGFVVSVVSDDDFRSDYVGPGQSKTYSGLDIAKIIGKKDLTVTVDPTWGTQKPVCAGKLDMTSSRGISINMTDDNGVLKTDCIFTTPSK